MDCKHNPIQTNQRRDLKRSDKIRIKKPHENRKWIIAVIFYLYSCPYEAGLITKDKLSENEECKNNNKK